MHNIRTWAQQQIWWISGKWSATRERTKGEDDVSHTRIPILDMSDFLSFGTQMTEYVLPLRTKQIPKLTISRFWVLQNPDQQYWKWISLSHGNSKFQIFQFLLVRSRYQRFLEEFIKEKAILQKLDFGTWAQLEYEGMGWARENATWAEENL